MDHCCKKQFSLKAPTSFFTTHYVYFPIFFPAFFFLCEHTAFPVVEMLYFFFLWGHQREKNTDCMFLSCHVRAKWFWVRVHLKSLRKKINGGVKLEVDKNAFVPCNVFVFVIFVFCFLISCKKARKKLSYQRII